MVIERMSKMFTPSIVTAIATLIGSLGVSWSVSSTNIAVLEEREQNHYLELKQSMVDMRSDVKEIKNILIKK